MQPRCSYPTSRYEAELHWEFERQRLRAHIASLPSSSFEKTKFEEDEGFYATFPEARQAAINRWIAEHFPLAPWAQSQVAQYQDITYDLSLAPCTSPFIASVPAPTVAFTTYTLADALKPPASPRKAHKALVVPKTLTPPMPAVHYDYGGAATSYDAHNSPDSILTTDEVLFNKKQPHVDQKAFSVVEKAPALSSPSPPPKDDDVLHTLQLLAPARRSNKHTRKLHTRSPPTLRNRENPYPSTSPTSSRSSLDTPPCSPVSFRSPSKPIIVPSNVPLVQPRYTGDWETDAIATAEYLHLALNTGKKHSVSLSVPALPLLPIEPHIIDLEHLPFRRHHQTRRHASRQRARPYSSPLRLSPRSPSRECSRSTSPPSKRPKMLRDKNGKPIMACLFCRGRKIACGPPPRGSSDPTCNQCARRGLECQYPTINRRGMRKKKLHVTVSEASASPSNAGAVLELAKVNQGISMSDYLDGSGSSDWDGD
ncbi:hypothetical protein C0989_007092 [Termitomyces sp. Mn162]|nr:hypothetical protein C0989_007092 [Termitomyces sp. Mn162]